MYIVSPSLLSSQPSPLSPRRIFISEFLAERRKEKFGNENDDDRGYTGFTDAADAPSELAEGPFGDHIGLTGSEKPVS